MREAPPASAGWWIAPGDRRVGILGGTFDPVHLGHLAVAEQVRESLTLDRILFVPARTPPHKPGRIISPVEDRLAMVQLAIAGNRSFAASAIEADRSGPSYSVDTVALLVDEAVRQGVDRELFFILSTEALAGLPGWRDPWRLLSLARIVVVPRLGYPFPDRSALEARFPGQAERVLWIETIQLAHSASDIRTRIRTGRSIRYLVPAPVEAYIRDHRLYRDLNAAAVGGPLERYS